MRYVREMLNVRVRFRSDGLVGDVNSPDLSAIAESWRSDLVLLAGNSTA